MKEAVALEEVHLVMAVAKVAVVPGGARAAEAVRGCTVVDED